MSMSRKKLLAIIPILLIGILVGTTLGVGLFYVPNVYWKPPWIPNDCIILDGTCYDASYAIAQIENSFTSPLPIDTTSLTAYVSNALIDVSSLVPASSSPVPPEDQPPLDQVAALSQDINALQANLPSATDYSDFAQQASVDASQSWDANIVGVADSSGDSAPAPSIISPFILGGASFNQFPLAASYASGQARPVVGAFKVSYVPRVGLTVNKLPANQLRFQGNNFVGTSQSSSAAKQYAVTTTRSVASNIIRNTANRNFYGSAQTFISGLGSGLLKFTQQKVGGGQIIIPIVTMGVITTVFRKKD